MMMMMTVLIFTPVLIGIVSCLGGTQAIFSPNVTVLSCTSHRVVVQLENGANSGLIYIQGRGSACSRSTTSYKMTYEFDFQMCNLLYDTKFRVIVQQNPHYQTGYDKVIPVMCLVDTGDLFVTGVIFPEERLDKAQNKTTRPTVSMRILADVDGAAVQEVTFDDKVKMSLTLDNPFIEDFDIKAKDCTAALIPIVKNECSADEVLFPNFEKGSRGNITSTFNAFQPTNIGGDPDVDVSFTCSIAVCKGNCQQTACGEIVEWGRRRRDADDDVIENVTVGTTLKVKSLHTEGQKTYSEDFCAKKVVVTTVTMCTGATLLISWVVCCCFVSKVRSAGTKSSGPKKPSALRRMSEKNINFARSVGRRLSTMLNLPVGYNMRDSKGMDFIPDVQPTPQTNRRNSVTVSHVDVDTFISSKSVDWKDQCECRKRKCCVDASMQTESVRLFSRSRDCTQSLNATSINSHPNPITSLSIKSNATNGKKSLKKQINDSQITKIQMELKKTKSESDVYSNVARSLDETAHPLDFISNSIVNVTEDNFDNESRIYFSADEISRNHETCRSIVSDERDANILCSIQNPDRNITEMDRTKTPPADYDTSINVNSYNIDEYDDVFGSWPSESKGGYVTPPNDYDSVFESPSPFSKTKLNDVTKISPPLKSDVGSPKVNKNIVVERENAQSVNTQPLQIKVPFENNDEEIRVDEPVYEAIEFGAQVQRERKYSTHV